MTPSPTTAEFLERIAADTPISQVPITEMFDVAVERFVNAFNGMEGLHWYISELCYRVRQDSGYGDSALNTFWEKIVEQGAPVRSASWLYSLAKTYEIFQDIFQTYENLPFSMFVVASATDTPEKWIKVAYDKNMKVSDLRNAVANQKMLDTGDHDDKPKIEEVSQVVHLSRARSEKLTKIKKVLGVETTNQVFAELLDRSVNGKTTIPIALTPESEKHYQQIQEHLIDAPPEAVVNFALQSAVRSLGDDPWCEIKSASDLPKGQHLYEKKSGQIILAEKIDKTNVADTGSGLIAQWDNLVRYCPIPARSVK